MGAHGLILVAPASPAPSACGSIEVPVLLLWARDDDIASYEEAEGLYQSGSGAQEIEIHSGFRPSRCHFVSEVSSWFSMNNAWESLTKDSSYDFY